MILFILCLIMLPPKVKSWTLKSGTKLFAFFDEDGTSRQLQLGTSCHLPTGCYLWPEGQNQWKNAVWECKTGGTWWIFARTNRNESFRSPNIGGTAIFGLGSWWPRGVVKGWSCGHGIFRLDRDRQRSSFRVFKLSWPQVHSPYNPWSEDTLLAKRVVLSVTYFERQDLVRRAPSLLSVRKKRDIKGSHWSTSLARSIV